MTNPRSVTSAAPLCSNVRQFCFLIISDCRFEFNWTCTATGSTLNHWPFPSRHLGEAYAYLLTHPGTPCIFYDHFVDGSLGDTVCKLIKIRRSNKINSRSKARASELQPCHCQQSAGLAPIYPLAATGQPPQIEELVILTALLHAG